MWGVLYLVSPKLYSSIILLKIDNSSIILLKIPYSSAIRVINYFSFFW